MLIHITLLIILDITLQRAFFTLKYVSKFFVKHAICIIDLLDTYLMIFPFSQCMSHQSRHTSQCRHKKSVPNAQHNQAVSVSACVDHNNVDNHPSCPRWFLLRARDICP